jgi:hypothetical protein
MCSTELGCRRPELHWIAQRWVVGCAVMWTGETLGRGDGGGLELLSKLDRDGGTGMARPGANAAAVEGARWLMWGWETLGGWGGGV